MVRSELKKDAKKSLKGNWGLMVGITLLLFSIPYAIAVILGPFYSKETETILAILYYLIILLVMCAISVGEMKVYLNLSEQKQVRFSQIFTFFTDRHQYFRATFTYALVTIYTILWTMLFVVPGIIKMLAYSMTPFILNDDPSLSYNQAITKSRQMMKGYKGKLFVLFLSFIGWYLLGYLSLGIGFLWINPYVNATKAQFYLKLREKWQTT